VKMIREQEKAKIEGRLREIEWMEFRV
jgi:hypothetical protein